MANLKMTTPPKGWNSWDVYGASVTESEVKENAAYMAENLLSHGWEYVVVDIQWYEPTADSSHYHAFAELKMDEYGRLLPAENRFPSAVNGVGFKNLSDYVHSLGLKFGIHIMRGIPRQAVHLNVPIAGTNLRARDIAHANSICPWNTDMYGIDMGKEGAQAYYDSIFKLYAEWGVDFIKVDDIADSKLYSTHLEEIKAIRKAIDKTGRDMVLSLSPGPAPLKYGTFFQEYANMWRLTDDFWDNWEQLKDMFTRCAQWSPFVGPGSWPDCDMLPLGHIGIRSVDGGGADRLTRFTKAEQRTMMTLWSIFRSPLMLGCELTDLDDWTLHLLREPTLKIMHQEGRNARQIHNEDDWVVWQTEANATVYYVIFNLSDTERVTPTEIVALAKLKNSETLVAHDCLVSY
ncbi:glycoside hydrolase family 27 protein [Jeotgalibaca porci]|uniref:Alpha-galactosidase n=1 Tax=Jeotgalibaca porci TaxID=1868793 RepID=A0A6G7WJ26_9LACT|nr:glycoside hydrolase family 27 protein [Jeotgalibaca porci]NLB98115.1 glycoside hydrolase family 27 protein [Lactobacillales bacterium]QIK52246.1 glycoside hydrolase family 27 protein [Jeotgalibaca porci]